MTRWTGPALFVLAALLFLVANRGAYKGYFQDDELDNISWTPGLPLSDYAKYALTPRFIPDNFRPIGHLYFRTMARHFGLDFPKYVFPIQGLHLLNVLLLWLCLRRLGCNPFGAGAGAAFFAFHMACFDIYWKPMYVFDLLCGTFVLATLLLWMHGRWVLAFLTFWLAYKSKELAVMLPFVLLAYEYWLGKRRWQPLLPMLAAGFSFGLQGLFLNPARGATEYAFRFGPRGIRETASFYAGRLLLFPGGGYALPALPLVVRDQRVWFGILALFLFFFPLAFLPGRMFPAYCYVPLIGAAVALAGIADRGHRLFIAVFFLVWIPFNIYHLRLNRRHALAVADENRRYVAALREFVPAAPATRQFIYDGRPFALHPWGIKGALAYLYGTLDITVSGVDDPGAQRALRSGKPVAVLSWDLSARQLAIASRRDDTPDAAYIRMGRLTPIWQLDDGWYPSEGQYRWAQPVATAHLQRPAGAAEFEITVNISPDLMRDMGRTSVRVWLDDRLIGEQAFTRNGWQTVRWPVPAGPGGRTRVRIQSDPYVPSNKDPRSLGIAVVRFGFPARGATP